MKSIPMIMSVTMVRATLDGLKTQTRRIVTNESTISLREDGTPGKVFPFAKKYDVGDEIWVRETWATQHKHDHLKPRHVPTDANLHYAATESLGGLRRRPSIFMPRWASRITLKVTGVRVERLNDISEADAIAEGVDRTNTSIPGYAKERFKNLWESIHGPGAWSANPWVNVVEFERVKP